MHTGKASSDMSNSGETAVGRSIGSAASSRSSVKSEGAAASAAAAAADLDFGECATNDRPAGKLTRTNSVRAKASMFQALEKQQRQEVAATPPKTEERPVRKCEYYSVRSTRAVIDGLRVRTAICVVFFSLSLSISLIANATFQFQ